MDKKIIIPALIMALSAPLFLSAQEQEAEKKVRIEITRDENGERSTVTRECELDDEAALEEILKELGVLDEMKLVKEGENLFIDLKRMKKGGAVEDMRMALSIDEEDMDLFTEAMGPKAYLGVYYADADDATCASSRPSEKQKGCCITDVEEGSPADKAGIQKGDLVVEIAGRTIASAKDLVETIGAQEPGTTAKVVLYRDGKKRTQEAELIARKQDRNYKYRFWSPDEEETFVWKNGTGAFLGVQPGDDESTGKGVLIGEVVEGSAAEKMGLKADDRIVAINGNDLDDFEALADQVGDMSPGDKVVLDIDREGKVIELKGELGERERMSWMMPPMPPGAPEAPDFPRAYRFEFDDEEEHAMHREMDELRREMQQLRDEIRGEVTREMRVFIGTVELSDEERNMLREKGVTGLDAELGLDELELFPNPGSGYFRLRFDVRERGDLNVDVHNATGERIYQETISGFKGRYERTLDLSDQANGNYFVVIKQGGKATSRKVIKQ
ncbi:MAG: PDZ domain-containing protein [Flavobacteriales bacterium]|nr:PDZ domain-containing protein [Flavobacteriales bacterium]